MAAPVLDLTVVIQAPAGRVLKAFFDPAALGAWWQVARAKITCTPVDAGTELRVLQNGFEEGVRWRRYYQVVSHGWERALGTLKALLEK